MSKRDERLFIIDIIDSTKAILEYIVERGRKNVYGNC